MKFITFKTIQDKGTFHLRQRHLISLGKKAHRQLSTELIGDTFIFASSNTGHFHHGFGRDTAFNAWFLDIAYRDDHTSPLWQKTKNAVLTYWTFQQPDGKIPHELKPYHPDDELGKRGFYDRFKDYYINRDSVDATPLMLIVTPLFIDKNSDEFQKLIPQAEKALSWIEENIDTHDGFLCYESNPKGLVSQGWMDSVHGGPIDKNGNLIDGYVALVEAQAFAWKSFLQWADLLEDVHPERAKSLREKARSLKEKFNKLFLMHDENGLYFSHALILEKGTGILRARLDVASINPGLCLWASYNGDTIFERMYVGDVVNRILSHDMFDRKAGIYTFAKGHALPNGDGYHNGERVVWPFASIAVGYGVLHLGAAYHTAGREIIEASIQPILKSGSFIEQATYTEKGTFQRYQVGDYISCKDQTWTVTAYVAALKTLGLFDKVLIGSSGFPKLISYPIKPFKNILKPSLTTVSRFLSETRHFYSN